MKKRTDLLICLGLSGGGIPILLALAAFANGVEINLRHVVGWSAAGTLTGTLIHLVRYQTAELADSQSSPNLDPESSQLDPEDFYPRDELARGLDATNSFFDPLAGVTVNANAVEQADVSASTVTASTATEMPAPSARSGSTSGSALLDNPYARDFLS